jgi:hypothetical protein
MTQKKLWSHAKATTKRNSPNIQDRRVLSMSFGCFLANSITFAKMGGLIQILGDGRGCAIFFFRFILRFLSIPSTRIK